MIAFSFTFYLFNSVIQNFKCFKSVVYQIRYNPKGDPYNYVSSVNKNCSSRCGDNSVNLNSNENFAGIYCCQFNKCNYSNKLSAGIFSLFSLIIYKIIFINN